MSNTLFSNTFHESQEKGKMRPKYILLTDRVATKRDRTLLSRYKTDDMVVLQGSLWQLFNEEAKDANRKVLILTSLEYDSVQMQCPASDVASITEIEFNLLVAMNANGERHRVHKERGWLREGLSITAGSVVYVLNPDGDLPNCPERVIGKVQYKGIISGQKGTWFGIELSADYHGKGDCDGQYEKHRYFQTQPNSALFVAINKIRQCPDPSAYTDWKACLTSNQDYQDDREHPPLVVGERVVWLSDTGPEHGTVKWIGYLHDTRDKEWTVGVEFDNRVGTGTGKYKDRQLFRARQGHASLVPIMGLIREAEFCDPRGPSPVSSEESIAATNGTLKMITSESGLKEQELLLDQKKQLEQYRTKQRQRSHPKIGTPEIPARKLPPNPAPSVVESIYDNSDGADFSSLPSESLLAPDGNELQPAYQNVQEIRAQARPATPPWPMPPSPVNDVPDGMMDERYSNFPPMMLPTPQQAEVHHYEALRHRRSHSNSSTSDAGSNKIYANAPSRQTTPNSPQGQLLSPSSSETYMTARSGSPEDSNLVPTPVSASELGTELDIGSMVEVTGNPANCKYGVVRWLGRYKDRNKPIVGLEMEEESAACTDGSFAGRKLFECPPKKAFFVYLHKVVKDQRFTEHIKYVESTESQAFGSLDCPEVQGTIPPLDPGCLDRLIGKHKGIQGHHNSCYLDATLFSMFAFTVVFDSILHRPRSEEDPDGYEEVQQVMLEGIVNPLRKNLYVRADRVLKFRTMLDKMGSVKGLTTEEKDPEEFLNSLLQQIMRVDPYLRLSNGQESYFYQLFLEKNEKLVYPTTQELLDLSFIQANIKLAEVPACLILQMPRFGKNYKMYKHIVPSKTLDITNILEEGPRECHSCGKLAVYECKECYNAEGVPLDIAYCEQCNRTFHGHIRRANHHPTEIKVNEDYLEYINNINNSQGPIPHETMELFAVMCIETSHYVTFVKCGTGDNAQWVFFDSMADRMGEQHGYNIPEVRLCPEVNQWLADNGGRAIGACENEQQLPELMRRMLCDSYMCFYQSTDVMMYK